MLQGSGLSHDSERCVLCHFLQRKEGRESASLPQRPVVVPFTKTKATPRSHRKKTATQHSFLALLPYHDWRVPGFFAIILGFAEYFLRMEVLEYSMIIVGYYMQYEFDQAI